MLGTKRYSRTLKRPSAQTNPKYAATVTMHEIASAGQNMTPRRMSTGKTKNSGNEAKTSQKMLCDSLATDSALPVPV
jgi:hypothetical protein